MASLAALAGLALAACSNSSTTPPPAASPTGSSTPPTSAPSSGASAEPTSGAGATSAIESNWATFFNAKTPMSQRLALLQNGQQFASVIRAQAGSSLASAATSKVTHVTLSGTSQAYVTYDILVGGKAALSGQQGIAIYQGGVWKVGDKSFCGLLKLENGGSSKGLPPGCTG